MPNPDPASEIPLPGATAQPSQQSFRIPPVECEHRQASRQLILQAAATVRPRRAIILGAGRCEEIPLAELIAAFDHLVLNDIDRESLDAALQSAGLKATAADQVELQFTDLTGVTEPFAQQAAALLKRARDPRTAVRQTADLLGKLTLQPTAVEETFDLVVASCLLSQVHVPLWHRAWRLFGERFPGHEQLLQESKEISTALEELARRMEDQLIDTLRRLVVAEGRVMLSATVRCCYFREMSEGDWTTPGWYRMTRSTDLAEYVGDSFEIIQQQHWLWVVMPPEITGPEGRIFDVVGGVLEPV